MMTRSKALQFIHAKGVLLVFPLQNKKEPASLWSSYFPRTPMRWEWDDGGDSRVAELWHLREELSRSQKVVYVKWFRNRATFFSPECFQWARAVLKAQPGFTRYSADAGRSLGIISDNSPLSTKQIKKQAKADFGLAGPAVEKSMVELWRRLLIVGFGEVDDGAFPSLAVGGSDQMFETWCDQADKLKPEAARAKLEKKLGRENLFLLELDKIVKSMQGLKAVKDVGAKKPAGKAGAKTGDKAPAPRTLRYEDLINN